MYDEADEDGGWRIAGYELVDSGAYRDQADENCEPAQAQQEAVAAVLTMVLSKQRSGGSTETQ
jgi:hypothetical protein|tara:strand:- start:364 stop:552 length:189 start_codon:yes stop_codon:yes gene_type:complete